MSEEFYDILADHYDVMQEGIDNKVWAGYIHGLISRYCETVPSDGKRLLCDLGCGTGKTTVEMGKLGYDIIGADLSVNMLNEAYEHASEAGVAAQWINMDITDLELPVQVDVFTAMTDTINHITSADDFDRMMRSLSENMKPGAVFIADVGTYVHYVKTLGDNVFYEDYDDMTLLWQNSWDGQISTSEITLFYTEDGSNYKRADADAQERYYSPEVLASIASSHGLTLEAVFGELSDEAPTDTDERMFIVIKKAVS